MRKEVILLFLQQRLPFLTTAGVNGTIIVLENQYRKRFSKSPPFPPPGRFGARQGRSGISAQTRIVSSPITWISFQQMRISSSLPKRPKQRHFPQTMIETRRPSQVLISTSETKPTRQPLFAFITSLFLSSVIEQQSIFVTSVVNFIHFYARSLIYISKKPPCGEITGE